MAVAAQMRDLLDVLRPNETVRDSGAVQRNWETFGQVYAHVMPLSGRERLRADQTEATVTHRIVLRTQSDIGPKWRLKSSDGTVYHLQSVIRATASRFMECLATEVA